MEAAEKVFRDALDKPNLAKLGRIRTPEVLLKIANAIAMCRPQSVFIISDSEADVRACRELALAQGEEKPLRLKDHTIHFDLPEDQGRMVDQTYYIANPDEEVSVLARKLLRDEGLAYVQKHMTRDHGRPADARGLLQPRARRRQGGDPGAHDLELGLRPSQRQHPVPQRLRSLRRRGEAGGRLLHQRAQPGHRTLGGHPQGSDLHGPELAHDVQHVLHLRRQHPDAQEGQPPVRRGPGHLPSPRLGALGAHVHHGPDRARRQEDLLRRCRARPDAARPPRPWWARTSSATTWRRCG